ncbi:MAG: site-specific integrase [Gammaproteobacteria bacterium]|nr:site-specific integrase [Gammaproteobacteria bacterium]
MTDDLSQRQINDGLYLYKRARSTRWQARIKRTDNEWFAMSCGTADFEAAKKVAIERQRQLLDAQSNGLVDVSRRFSDVARLTIKHLDAEVTAGVGKSVNRDYKQVINRYLIPALGKYQINHIDHKALIELDAFRNKLLNRQPNRSTLNTHNAALRRVFKTAVDRGFILPLQVPQLVNRGRPPRARPYFDQDDYRRVSRNLREFAGTGHKKVARYLRDLLWDYALILANTGMRTGEEALNLKWNQIKRTKEIDQKSVKREKIDVLKFSVTGKKRPRTLICRDVDGSVTTPLNRIQSRFPDLANLKDDQLFKVDEYVFRTVDGKRPRHERLVKAFKAFLKKYDLLTDKEGQERTLYSLRHTYATTQLRNGVTWDDLAIQMGTSRIMLERHYSKFKVEDRAADFSGLNEKRKKNAAKEKTELQKANAMIKSLEKTIRELTKTIQALTKEKV